ncbi:MAG: hypothetical protein AB9917_08300 [Negativicutes bacterium]
MNKAALIEWKPIVLPIDGIEQVTGFELSVREKDKIPELQHE